MRLHRLSVLLLALCAIGPCSAAQNADPLTIERIFAAGGLTGREPSSIEWSPDGKRISYVLRDDSGEHGQLMYVDVATGQSAVLVSEEKLNSLLAPASKLKDEREKERRARYSVAGYHWAPDARHILFDSNGQLWLYSLDTQTGIPFTSTPESSGDPKFAPDGSRIAYLRKHNLYVRPISGAKERALTRDTDPNLLNGEVDWLYAEELDVRSNYFWSPDSRRIVFLQMDQTQVPTHAIEDFIPPHPTVDNQKYPQAGEPNPAVHLGVVAADGGRVRWITLPEQKEGEEDPSVVPAGSRQDIYIPRFGWLNAQVLYALVLNRAQDELKLYFMDAGSGRSQLVLDEKDEAWVDVNDDLHFLSSQPGGRPDQFLWSSWRDGHTHLYLYRFNAADPLSGQASLVRRLTSGEWEVTGVRSVQGGRVYFTGNKDDARQRQLYSVKLDGSGFAQVTGAAGTHEVTMSDGVAGFYIDRYSSLMSPARVSLCHEGGACEAFWEPRSVAGFNLAAPQMLEFKAEDGTALYGQLILPTGTPPAGGFPLLLYPYGGPGAQTVRNAWGGSRFLFHQMLARNGVAVLTVDNRGMAARGRKFTAALRRNFGETELKDQLAALDQALQRFPQLNSKRLGWWGWSYGGYMTLFALTHSDRFTAGVAVAPVTDWRDYDSTYTERYMGLPQQNKDGYKKSSPVNFATSLHGALLMVHGTGDDNVHPQNTLQMTQAFINAGRRFELMLYPRKTHSISGAEAQTDLFHRIQDHFERHLLGAPPVKP